MTLTSDAQVDIDTRRLPFSRGSALEKLSIFFERMKKAGIAKALEYDLPLVDTLGRAVARLAESLQ